MTDSCSGHDGFRVVGYVMCGARRERAATGGLGHFSSWRRPLVGSSLARLCRGPAAAELARRDSVVTGVEEIPAGFLE